MGDAIAFLHLISWDVAEPARLKDVRFRLKAMAAPVAASSPARSTLTRFPFSSPRNIMPPPAPQQKDRARARGGSITLPITCRGSS